VLASPSRASLVQAPVMQWRAFAPLEVRLGLYWGSHQALVPVLCCGASSAAMHVCAPGGAALSHRPAVPPCCSAAALEALRVRAWHRVQVKDVGAARCLDCCELGKVTCPHCRTLDRRVVGCVSRRRSVYFAGSGETAERRSAAPPTVGHGIRNADAAASPAAARAAGPRRVR